MNGERDVIVETFIPLGEASRSHVRVRPLPGQGISTSLRVQCSKAMRDLYERGTRFVLRLKFLDRGGGPFLHAHHNAPFRLATAEDLQRLLGPQADDLAALLGVTEATEGERRAKWTAKYERDPAIRKAAIELHGTNCMACGFSFGKAYGRLGEGFVEVHHVRPVAGRGRTKVSVKTDLVVLCSNCHSMVHRRKGKPLELLELRAMLSRSR